MGSTTSTPYLHEQLVQHDTTWTGTEDIDMCAYNKTLAHLRKKLDRCVSYAKTDVTLKYSIVQHYSCIAQVLTTLKTDGYIIAHNVRKTRNVSMITPLGATECSPVCVWDINQHSTFDAWVSSWNTVPDDDDQWSYHPRIIISYASISAFTEAYITPPANYDDEPF